MPGQTWERPKDPEEVVDYQVNWEPQLDGDTLSSSLWIVPLGITKDSDSNTALKTTIWLSGGTIGQTYEFVNRVVTVGARTFDQTCKLKVKVR